MPVDRSPVPPLYNLLSGSIFGIFSNYLFGRSSLSTPMGYGVLVVLTERDHFIPDAMVVCDPDKIKHDAVYGAPDLVVEVLSPGTARRDRGYKKDVYESCGVREYWIVSPHEKSVEQYVLENGRFSLRRVASLCPAALLRHMNERERAEAVSEFPCALFDDLTIHLSDVFRRVPEE